MSKTKQAPPAAALRVPGHYWVQAGGKWEPVEWTGKEWWGIAMQRAYTEDELTMIGPLLPPPDPRQFLSLHDPMDLRAIGDFLMSTCVGETDQRLVDGIREARNNLYLIVGGGHCEFRVPPRQSDSLPDDLREAGWVVAVHNDYRLNGESHTFWLFTKQGRAIKGEGRSDREALNNCRRAAAKAELEMQQAALA